MTAAPGSIAAAGARYRIAPLAMAIDVAELERFAISAAPGADLVYAAGHVPPSKAPAFVRARALYEAGVVELRNPKLADGSYQWIARKRPVPAAIRDGLAEARASIWQPDAIDLAIIARLKAVANGGGLCPANAELAAEFGLGEGRRGADAASWRVRKAVRAGAIAIELRGPNARRIARDPETGRCSAEGRL